MINSDQTGRLFFFFYTAQKHLQRGHIRAMYRLPYHFQLTLPFLPATPNRVNLKLLSPEQALCSEFVINPDLSITIHWLSSSPDGYTDVGDVNTGKRKIGSWSGEKAGERSLQRLTSEHLNVKCNPQHRGKSLGCLYNIQGRWGSVPAGCGALVQSCFFCPDMYLHVILQDPLSNGFNHTISPAMHQLVSRMSLLLTNVSLLWSFSLFCPLPCRSL